ncbi:MULTISPECIES: septum formation initiator family protein [Arthrobacter]|uniref:Septum formation initiator family protein n=2 Tax=Arthrobacter TaxID=1663 RepID=A0ABU9KLJ1_9MICC|nr:septum formation initiator family protein [Arthrobacter sp. YJM1]MDP5227430.1 septum formation initiator family protein [Arthrobacter sp. YJM1]
MATRRPKVPRAHVLDGGARAPRAAERLSAAERPSAPAPEARDAEVTELPVKVRPKPEPKAESGKSQDGHGSHHGKSKTAVGKPAGGSGKGHGDGSGKKSGKDHSKSKEQDAAPVPARAFSGRLLALGLVMVAITVLLAPTVKNWWDQRQQISQLQADIRARQAERQDLTKQISRWNDPAYVRQQARDRINMVMPGEIGYWVFGKDGGTAGIPAGTPDGTAAATGQDEPWTQKFLDSVREANK